MSESAKGLERFCAVSLWGASSVAEISKSKANSGQKTGDDKGFHASEEGINLTLGGRGFVTRGFM